MYKPEVKLTIIRSQSPGELSAKCKRGGNKKRKIIGNIAIKFYSYRALIEDLRYLLAMDFVGFL